MRNTGGVQQYQNTHTQDERQDLCLEDGTSKIVWVANCRILFLEEIWLQEREICTQQDVMDANNFNILWTEASWFGNKYLTPHYPNQGNCLYLKQTPSKAHNLILLKKKWNSTVTESCTLVGSIIDVSVPQSGAWKVSLTASRKELQDKDEVRQELAS